MGNWNSTCALSNLPIFRGDKVVFLVLAENIVSYLATEVSSLWAPIALPMYAKYNDLGSIEQWSKSEAPVLEMALDYFKKNLVPFTTRRNDGNDVNVSKETLTFEQLLASLREGDAKIPLYGQGNATCVSVLIRRDVWDSLLEMEISDFLGRPQSVAHLKARSAALLEDVRARGSKVGPGETFYLMSEVYENVSCPLQRSLGGREAISPQCELYTSLRAALARYGQKPTSSNQKQVELLLSRHIELTTIGYVMDATRRCWQPTSAMGDDPNFEVHRAFQARIAKVTAELEQKMEEDCL